MTNLILVQFVLWIFVSHPWELEGIKATVGWHPWLTYKTEEECLTELVEYVTKQQTPAECHKSVLMPTIYGNKPSGDVGSFQP